MRGGFYDKETGRELQWPSQMVNYEMDSESIAWALGSLLDALIDRNVISRQDVLEIIPDGNRNYTQEPPKNGIKP